MPLQATSGAASYDAFGGGVAAVPKYIEDYFSTFLYSGTGATQTITNGIDLSTKGGLVWLKRRTSVGGTAGHRLYDTNRGVAAYLQSNATAAESSYNPNLLSAFLTTGFTLGSEGSENGSGDNYVSWSLAKAPKFFDVVTWTGTGVDGQVIPHSLGVKPSVIIVKRTDTTSNWQYNDANDNYLILNSTAASDGSNRNGGWIPQYNTTATTLTTQNYSGNSNVNESGGTYVAYLFASNAGGFGLTGTDNVISCGSYTGNGNNTIELGYEPQWIMVRRTNTAGNDWEIYDTMRDCSLTGSKVLVANSSAAEGVGGGIYPTATGFYNSSFGSGTIIYIAIRRGPMKVPTSGTSVFAPFNTSVTSNPLSFTSNFPVDFALTRKSNGLSEQIATSRLQGGAYLDTTLTAAEAAPSPPYWTFDSNTQITSKYWNVGFGTVQSMLAFQRAPSFFDEVCYLGTGSATTFTHNLGVVPELMIVKTRTESGRGWAVYAAPLGATKWLRLELTNAEATASTLWNNTAPTSSVFTVGTSAWTNNNTQSFVNYLFATCAGVSKVFSYTGNGSSQTINCGFTGGARFVLIKRTDSTGDWYVLDSARGIVSGNDPHLSLNTTAAEVTTDDTIDTDSTGFVVNQVSATDVNVSSATYIGLAIA